MELQNPFVLVGEIPDAYFCDRVEETKMLCQLVAGGANVCLSAPRRIGKSKLIWHCFHQTQWKDYYTIYVDLYHTNSLTSFTKTLGNAVFEQVLGFGDKVAQTMVAALRSLRPTVKFDALNGQPVWGIDWSSMQSVEPALEDVFAALEKANKPCIVALDEFQQIAQYPERNVEALLRGLIQNMKNCHFIFSGSKRHLLTQIFTSPSHPFYQSTEPFSLKPIPLEKYEEFVRFWMSRFGKSVEDGIVERIYKLSEGNTAFLQRTMHYAFDCMEQGECLDESIAMRAIDTMLKASDEFYKEQLSHLNDRQQDLLYAIAKERRAEKILGGAFVRKYNLLSSSAVQAAQKKLIEDGWISEENGQYYISDTILRLYIAREMGVSIELK